MDFDGPGFHHLALCMCGGKYKNSYSGNGVVHLLRQHSSSGEGRRVCLEEERPSQTAWGENTSDAENCNSSGKHQEVITQKRLKMSG